MGKHKYWILFLTILSSIFCIFYKPKHQQKTSYKPTPIILSKSTANYSIEPPLNTHTPMYIHGNDHVFLLDPHDLHYYQSKQEREREFEQRYTQLCQERDIQVPELHMFDLDQDPREPGILEQYIINDILGNHEIRLAQTEDRLPMYMDTQNVHDNSIQKQLKKRYTDHVVDNPELVFSEHEIVREAKRQNKDTKTLIKVLKTMKKRNANLMNYNGDSEMTILENTWKAGDDNVKEQIINNLIECHEHNIIGQQVVCPTGVASRIVESTYINDPENTPRTKDMYREEMLSKASQIRFQLEQNPEYNAKSDQEQTEQLKSKLLTTYQQDYKNILTHHDIHDLTKDWIDYI